MLAGPADAAGAFEALGGFMDPEGAGSVEAAVEADSTWGGSVDYGRLVSVGNVGRRKVWGGVYAAADFEFEFTKSAWTGWTWMGSRRTGGEWCQAQVSKPDLRALMLMWTL